jgi:hypothetical protein
MSFVLKRFRGSITFADKIGRHGSFANSLKASLYRLNGHTPPDNRRFFAVTFLEKMFEYCISTLKLIPGNGTFENEDTIPVWDISSLASLTRCMMDCYLNFIFMVVSPRSNEEFIFRLDLSNYIAEAKRVSILETGNPLSVHLAECRQIMETAKQRLSDNSTFQGLIPKEQTDLLRAKSSILIPGEELARMGGLNLAYYRSLQKFLSCHSHFYGYALSQFLVFDPNTPDAQVWYGNCLDYLSLFMAFFLRDVGAIYPELEPVWEPIVKQNIQFWNGYMVDGMGEG